MNLLAHFKQTGYYIHFWSSVFMFDFIIRSYIEIKSNPTPFPIRIPNNLFTKTIKHKINSSNHHKG